MRSFEFITEGKLKRDDFYAPDRVEMFIKKMSQGLPFKQLDGTEVVLKKDNALLSILSIEKNNVSRQNLPSIPNQLTDIDGNPVRLSELEKTIEFGSTEKEKFPVKPSHLPSLSGEGPSTKVNISDPDVIKNILEKDAFPAGQLADRIIKDPVLNKQAGKLGKAIIEMTKQIMAGTVPTIPAGLSKSETTALRDYAGEYLGVLQMVKGIAEFPNSGPFFEHLGTNDLSSLKLYFPKATATPLADSLGAADGGIAAVQSPTGTVMKISSKGDKIGAPPSLDNLDSKAVRGKKWAKEVVVFIDIAKGASSAEQPFRLINYLNIVAPDTIDAKIKQLLPFSDKDIGEIINVDKMRPANPKALALYKMAGAVKGSKFGKCHYAVNKEVIASVNKDGSLPNLKKAVLEILGSNFIQIYSQIKGDKLQAYVLWPNKVNGDVYLYSKAYADAPTKGKLSFYVSK
jgi:hypothetical protein